MDKNAIKKYAVWARNELIARVTQKAQQYGITETDIIDANADSINGKLLTDIEKKQRQALIAQIKDKGFDQVNNDLRILACAFDYDYYQHPDETIFVTNDLALKAIANCFFGEDSIESVNEEELD